MITFAESIWSQIKPHVWKYEPRIERISVVLVHATRSGLPNRTSALEYSSTKNWFISPHNRTVDAAGRVSAGMTNAVIGDGGKLCIALPDEFYPTWSAGHMDPIAWSVEIAQANNGDPYHPLDIERAEHEIAAKCRKYGIPAKSIQYMEGDNQQAPGIAYHDRSRNGTILGKSDPGSSPPFNDRPLWVRTKIAPLITGQEEEMLPFFAWDIGRSRIYFVGNGGAGWCTSQATIDELARVYSIPPTTSKALSTAALQALGADR